MHRLRLGEIDETPRRDLAWHPDRLSDLLSPRRHRLLQRLGKGGARKARAEDVRLHAPAVGGSAGAPGEKPFRRVSRGSQPRPPPLQGEPRDVPRGSGRRKDRSPKGPESAGAAPHSPPPPEPR